MFSTSCNCVAEGFLLQREALKVTPWAHPSTYTIIGAGENHRRYMEDIRSRMAAYELRRALCPHHRE